jgi:hypothetical protein
MNFLKAPFIKPAAARLIQPGVAGLALVGGHARGQAALAL